MTFEQHIRDQVKHLTMEQLEAELDAIRASPRDGGIVQMIVRRLRTESRELLDECELNSFAGLVGDNWKTLGKTMADENQFFEDEHPISRRFAVLDDVGTTAWICLTELYSRKPAADAWIYNRIAAPPFEAIKAYRGGPPPAAQGRASETALCKKPMKHKWSFVWSANGESVAVARDGETVAFIVLGNKRGHSRELVKDGPWGHLWSGELFRETFGAALARLR